MPRTMARFTTSMLLLLAFTIVTLSTLPASTQGSRVTMVYVPQTTTVSATTETVSNTTSTSVTGTQTNPASTNGTATTTSLSGQWDLLIPVLVIGVGAGLTVIVAAVLLAMRKRKRVMPTVQLICSRCRAPVNPRDTVCRTCGIPLYHPYRFYPRRR